jgi:hypothetical protein
LIPLSGEELEVFLTAASTDFWSGKLDLIGTTPGSSSRLAMGIFPVEPQIFKCSNLPFSFFKKRKILKEFMIIFISNYVIFSLSYLFVALFICLLSKTSYFSPQSFKDTPNLSEDMVNSEQFLCFQRKKEKKRH